MYDRDATETSKGALVELCRALRQYRSDMVLAGGWAPYFLVEGFFDHCGSVDIDFVLRPTIVERYERIKQVLERLGYKPTGSVFRFERTIVSPKTSVKYRVEVDFLTEPEGVDKLPENVRSLLDKLQVHFQQLLIELSNSDYHYSRIEAIDLISKAESKLDKDFILAILSRLIKDENKEVKIKAQKLMISIRKAVKER